jgi:hypothetical protein
MHHTTLETCDCKGFLYRRTCRHLSEVQAMVEMVWDSGEEDEEPEDGAEVAAAEFCESSTEEVAMGNSNPLVAAIAGGVPVRLVVMGPEPMLGTSTPAIVAVASERDTNNRLQYEARERTMSTPDDDLDLEDLRWAHYCAVAKRLDAGEIINLIGDEIMGEPGETPISALVDAYLAHPEPDWDRPLLSAYHAESIGRYVGAIAAKIVEREIGRAVDRLDERSF